MDALEVPRSAAPPSGGASTARSPSGASSHAYPLLFSLRAFFPVYGGESGIRTHGTLASTPDFESGTFGRSVISPRRTLTKPNHPVNVGDGHRSAPSPNGLLANLISMLIEDGGTRGEGSWLQDHPLCHRDRRSVMGIRTTQGRQCSPARRRCRNLPVALAVCLLIDCSQASRMTSGPVTVDDGTCIRYTQRRYLGS